MSVKLICSHGHEWTAVDHHAQATCPICGAKPHDETLNVPAERATHPAAMDETLMPPGHDPHAPPTRAEPASPAAPTQEPPFHLIGDTLLPATEVSPSSH